jgi:hypothetical protein
MIKNIQAPILNGLKNSGAYKWNEKKGEKLGCPF